MRKVTKHYIMIVNGGPRWAETQEVLVRPARLDIYINDCLHDLLYLFRVRMLWYIYMILIVMPRNPSVESEAIQASQTYATRKVNALIFLKNN